MIDGDAVAYSADGGATWTRTKLNTSTITGSQGRVEIAYAKSNPNIAYAVVNYAKGQFYDSTDGGKTWKPNTPLSTPAHLGIQGWYDNSIWVAPNDPKRVIVGGEGSNVKMSTDGGVTWYLIKVLHDPLHYAADYHTFVSDPNYATNATIYLGTDSGVYKVSNLNNPPVYKTYTYGDGTTVTYNITPSSSHLEGLSITQFYGAAGKAGGRILGGAQDNGTLLWSGTKNWVKIWGADGGFSAADQADGNYVYGMDQYAGIFRQNHALSATSTSYSAYICQGITDAQCPPVRTAKTLFVTPMKLDITNTTLYVGAQNLWRSTNIKNSTVSWSIIKGPKSNGSLISAIAISSQNPNIVWVGYKDSTVACTENATAASPTWIEPPFASFGRMINRMTIDPANPSVVYVGLSGYTSPNLQKTTGGCTSGTTFLSAQGDLPAVPVRAILINPNNSSVIYAGTEVGFFTSFDGGTHWLTTNTGPGNVSVDDMFWLDDSTIIVATHGRGMFRAVVSNVPPADTTAPTVSITVPASGSTTSGSVNVSATASDNLGVAGVQFKLDGANLGSEDTTPPYSVVWNTAQTTNASHTLTAIARDAAGNTTTSTGVAVTVSNTATSDTTPPSVPSGLRATAFSSSQINLSWSASTDNVGVAGYKVYRNGTLVAALGNVLAYQDTNLAANTSYFYTVSSSDAAGNTSLQSAPTTATTQSSTSGDADTTAPSVSISPNGGIASGVVTLTISSSDNSGTVSRVELYKDGALVGSNTGSTYSYSWNTTSETSGTHTIGARAYDPSSNAGSATAAFSVNNMPSMPDATPPSISIIKPVTGSTVPKGSLKITTSANDDKAVAKIEILLNGSLIATCLNVTSCPATASVKTMPAGVSTITATAYDAAGNTGVSTVTVTK
jgi:chitodextrinase